MTNNLYPFRCRLSTRICTKTVCTMSCLTKRKRTRETPALLQFHPIFVVLLGIHLKVSWLHTTRGCHTPPHDSGHHNTRTKQCDSAPRPDHILIPAPFAGTRKECKGDENIKRETEERVCSSPNFILYQPTPQDTHNWIINANTSFEKTECPKAYFGSYARCRDCETQRR